jgi:hypothetical protein
MSVSGLCEICESREAEYSCDRCGALVCEQHFARPRGLCGNCARALGEDGNDPEEGPSPGDTFQL